MNGSDLTLAVVHEAIGRVIDPCSRFNGTQLSLIDLGMVEQVRIQGRTIDIRLLLDDPSCLYAFVIQKEIRNAVGALPGVDEISIELIPDQVWTEDRMPAAARERLNRHRTQRRAHLLQVTGLALKGHAREDGLGDRHDTHNPSA